jgi:peptidyl-Lys metalloendopeptidase
LPGVSAKALTVAALAASLVTLGSVPALAAADQHPVTLTAAPQYRLGEPVTLTFELRNATDHDYSALTWDTPLENLGGEALDYVRVRRDGAEVPYGGRVVKRADPDASAYRVLHPGESVRERFDLSTAFALTRPGTYTVTLDTALEPASATFRLVPGGQPRRTVAETLTAPDARASAGPKFEDMSAERRKLVEKAVHAADRYVQQSYDYLRAHGDSERYRTWFGAFDRNRFDTVESHFKKIGHDADDTTYHGDCDKPGVFAYVYPNVPDQMWLCPAFWNAPMTGKDSKGGTIVHEQSHYLVNGGTQDYVYGHDGCRSLARNDPAKAIMNADSHEYFAENT